jgi:transglutaminase-like putative cysteine protease
MKKAGLAAAWRISSKNRFQLIFSCMMRFASVVLLVVLVGCSQQKPEPPATALTHASALRDKGDFKEAAIVLGAALDATNLSADQRKELEFQKDLLKRLKLDYSWTRNDLFRELSDSVQDLTSQEFDQWIAQGRFDSRKIDGKTRFMNTSTDNLFFRYPELTSRRLDHEDDVPEQKGRMLISLAIKKAARAQRTPYVLPHYLLCTMTVTVKQDALPFSKFGKMIRAWLPIPREYPYQNQFKLIRSSTPAVALAPETSPIRSAYFEQYSSRNRPTIFSITYSYMRAGVYFDMDPAKVRPADLQDPVLKKFASEAPHVAFTDKIKELANKIAGNETNQLLEAKAFYDWIGGNIKYSYAREYSTLTNISMYCMANGYGDCGQEALLFITLCRSRGIPARWQTGWDLFPGYHDIHDWSEIYLAPYGWVPVDPWAGLYATSRCTALTPAQRRDLHDFYFGGLDYYRMAANGDHSQPLDPPKQTLRSDDVDFQRGEVECGQRNIYFNNYSYNMHVQEFGCPPFSVDQLKDFPALANRLIRQSDPVSVFVWQKLSPEEQLQLKNHEPSGPSLKPALEAMIQALNGIIEIGEPGIYERKRFQDVSLRPETSYLVSQNPTGADLSRLNRLLLEDAYPAELSKSQESK